MLNELKQMMIEIKRLTDINLPDLKERDYKVVEIIDMDLSRNNMVRDLCYRPKTNYIIKVR